MPQTPTSEQSRNNIQLFKDFYLEIEAIIWPCLSYMVLSQLGFCAAYVIFIT